MKFKVWGWVARWREFFSVRPSDHVVVTENGLTVTFADGRQETVVWPALRAIWFEFPDSVWHFVAEVGVLSVVLSGGSDGEQEELDLHCLPGFDHGRWEQSLLSPHPVSVLCWKGGAAQS